MRFMEEIDLTTHSFLRIIFPTTNIGLFPPFVNSGWARLAAYMDHIYSTKPLNSPGMANRGFCLSETFSSSDVNRRILFA